MTDALIGSSGFVGTTLQRQHAFDAQFRSTNIDDIRGGRFDVVACAGAPGQKWRANQDPAGDRASLERLRDALAGVRCRRFVLISTVDVFHDPVGVDEDSPIETQDLSPYGLHRYELEQFVLDAFGAAAIIVRLPGLVGPGLRKNLLYDFQHANDIGKFDARSTFQFYPTVNLWPDIGMALDAGLPLVHLTAAPIAVGAVAAEVFGRDFNTTFDRAPAAYDMRTRHAAHFGSEGPYQYDRRASLLAMRAYHQSEPVA